MRQFHTLLPELNRGRRVRASVSAIAADSSSVGPTLRIGTPLDRLISMKPDTPSPSALIESHMGLVDAYLVRTGEVSTAEARVLQRQRSMLADLQEAVAAGVPTVDLAYEGDFDPIDDSLTPSETGCALGFEIHSVALAGIEPIVQAVRAHGIAVHAPEIEFVEDEATRDTRFAELAADTPNAF